MIKVAAERWKICLESQELKKRVNSNARTLRKKRPVPIPLEENMTKQEDELKEKIKILFLKTDKDKNGWLSRQEFQQFVHDLIGTDEDIHKEMFDSIIQEHNYEEISFEEFYFYLTSLTNEKDEKGKNIRKKFVLGNRDLCRLNTMAIKKRRKLSLKNITKKLSRQVSSGLHVLIERSASQVSENDQDSAWYFEEKLSALLTNEDEEELVEYIKSRWEQLVNYKRRGKNGEVVMYTDEQITDALPGTYDLFQLVMDQFDEKIISTPPRHAILKPVKWISAPNYVDHGQLLCPKYWNCTIPIDIGTDQNLCYYGASLASKKQQQIALLHRHATVDFIYGEDYQSNYVANKGGGFGMEMHEFHHMVCPLQDDSGYFILGKKISADEMHLTAFKIPKNHVLYIPPNSIHSNDYLKGKWRTMLTDEVYVDQVHFLREAEQGYYEKVHIQLTQ